MKPQNNKRSARTSSKKVIVSNNAKGLTSQAGLIPVVKFLRSAGMLETIKGTIDHKRGGNALYDAVDAVFLSVVAIIGGARSIRSVTTLWADGSIKTFIRLVVNSRQLYTWPFVCYIPGASGITA